jgi:hypothetical protein
MKFAGWTPEMPASTHEVVADETYTATWELEKYDVTFNYKDDEGADKTETQKVAYGGYAVVVTPGVPEHKTFVGWVIDGTTKPLVQPAEYQIKAKTAFTAVYDDETVAYTFDYNDGTGDTVVLDVPYNGTIYNSDYDPSVKDVLRAPLRKDSVIISPDGRLMRPEKAPRLHSRKQILHRQRPFTPSGHRTNLRWQLCLMLPAEPRPNQLLEPNITRPQLLQPM